jgi:hypothetical protein
LKVLFTTQLKQNFLLQLTFVILGFAGIQKNTGNIPDDLNNFDAEFFGYSESEANSLDCTLRMLLEKTYEAILDSGNKTSQ